MAIQCTVLVLPCVHHAKSCQGAYSASLLSATDSVLNVPADIPLKKAVAGVRVGLLPEAGFVVNPTVQQMETSKLDLVMAGTDSAVLMIEGYCDFLTEEQMLEVCSFSADSTHKHQRCWCLTRNIYCGFLMSFQAFESPFDNHRLILFWH